MRLTVSVPAFPPSYPPSLLTVLLPVRYHLPRSWFRLVFVFSVSRLVSRRCHNSLALPRPLPTYGTMGVLTPAAVHPGGRYPRLLPITFRPCRPQPQNAPRHRFVRPVQRDGWVSGFAIRSQARRNIPPNRVRHPTDRPFASGCSPPRLAATQLPSATEFWHTPTRTSTVLVMRHHGRTSVKACFDRRSRLRISNV